VTLAVLQILREAGTSNEDDLGLSLRQVAEKAGVDTSQVSQAFHRLGLHGREAARHGLASTYDVRILTRTFFRQPFFKVNELACQKTNIFKRKDIAKGPDISIDAYRKGALGKAGYFVIKELAKGGVENAEEWAKRLQLSAPTTTRILRLLHEVGVVKVEGERQRMYSFLRAPTQADLSKIAELSEKTGAQEKLRKRHVDERKGYRLEKARFSKLKAPDRAKAKEKADKRHDEAAQKIREHLNRNPRDDKGEGRSGRT
jgi:DNA-binding transcriptional regulator YhcF (GntR family)